MSVVVVTAIATGAHLGWAYRHARPNVQLTDDLRIVETSPAADATGLVGYRITAANGQEVRSRAELDTVGIGTRFLATEAVPVSPSLAKTRRTLWWEMRQPLRFEVDAGGLILELDRAPPEIAADVVGARLTAIDGTPLAAVLDVERALQRNAGMLRVSLAPLGIPEEPLDLIVVRLDWRVQSTLWLVGVLFACLGFGVYRLKPSITSSLGFFAFSIAVSLFWMFRSVPYHYRVPAEGAAFYVLQCFLPLAALCFLGTFSPLRVLFTSLRLPLLATALAGALLIAVNQVLYPDDASAAILGEPLFVAWLVVMLSIVLLSQPTRLWFRLRGLSVGPIDRQRATALRVAALLGFVPLTVFYIATGAQLIDLSQRLWFELTLLAFPLIVVYAIVRHNLLQLGELAREGVAIGLLMLSLGLAYAAATAAIGPVAETLLGTGGGELSQAMVVGASAFVLAPLYAGTRRRLLHRYHAADHLEDYLQALAGLAETQQNLDAFCDEAVLIISSALKRSPASLLLRQTSTGTWRVAASTEDPRAAVDVNACRPLLQLLLQTKSSLDQNEILEDRRYRGQRRMLLQAWRELDATVVAPLHCRDRLVGALVLGSKPGVEVLPAREMRFVESLRSRLAMALSRWFTATPENATTATASYPAYPRMIGHYRVDRLLGEGGMCYVYLARDDDREVAIKVPNPRTLSDDTRLERFLRESQAMKRVSHPQIVEVLDDGISHGEPFIVVEYFPDGSFSRYLNREQPLDEALAMRLVRDLAGGLEAALDCGIVHRDVKPSNVFLTSNNVIKLGDFGIANVADEPTLTEPGSVIGSPAYISPEIASGLGATWKSDQYSLGICLFEMLAGRRPFKAPTLAGLLHLHMTEPTPDLTQQFGVSEHTQSVLARMTEKKPERRFRSYPELRKALATTIDTVQG
jgi:GAF domain-containing protein